MRTGQLAAKAGVNLQTVLYYERRGLLVEPPRRESGYREYGQESVQALRFIKRAQQLGFTTNARPIHPASSHRQGNANQGSSACVTPDPAQYTRGIQISRSPAPRRCRQYPLQRCTEPEQRGHRGLGTSICRPCST